MWYRFKVQPQQKNKRKGTHPTTKSHSLLSFPHFNLIRLNSNFDKLTKEEQGKWLEENLELSKLNNKKMIICPHHSTFSSVSFSSNYYVQMLRKHFVSLFEQYNENIIIVILDKKKFMKEILKKSPLSIFWSG
tara:strand:+ start:203 stop:601 length:399 start_codon:yes stop_codon:yes gene_type:complete